MDSTNKLKQPKSFKLAFSTATCERFGFYVLNWILVLYVKQAFNLSDTQAYTVFGVFTALVFVTPSIGGYLADNILGIRRSMIIGLFLEGLGLCTLSIANQTTFPIGLALIILGVGFYKTTATHILGRSYEKNDPRIDSGFTYFYMAINIGSFAASMSAGFIQLYIGWNGAFLLAGIMLFAGLFFYYIFRKSAVKGESNAGLKPLSIKIWIYIIVGILVVGLIAVFLLHHTSLAKLMSYLCAFVVLIYFIFQMFKSSKKDSLKIIACIILMLMGIVFFIFYNQAYMSMELFVSRCVDRNILNFNVPVTSIMSLNPFWILVLSPFLAAFYNHLNKKGGDFSVTSKFVTGLLIISICFIVLKFSTFFFNSNYKISPFWIVAVLFLYSFAELLISALGVAMVTRISPKRYYGIMMGAWYLCTSIAGILSGMFASLAEVPTGVTNPKIILDIYGNAYLKMGAFGLIATVISFFAAIYIRKIEKMD